MPRGAVWSRILMSSLLMSVGVSTLAFAQENSGTIETVTVTAEKRTENVQKVPVSIQVLSGHTIEQFHQTDLHSVMNQIPNLFVLQSGVDDVVSIRGFGSGPNNIAFDQEVSIYNDGIYGGRSAQFMEPMFDIDHMEVLRGPQGALFGKNTAAGAINIVTADPTPNFEAMATASYDFDMSGPQVYGYVAGPIADDLGARLAVKFVDQNGFIKNVATGKEDPHTKMGLGRLTLKWEPTADFDMTGKLEIGDERITGGINVSVPLNQLVNPPSTRYAVNPYIDGLPEENEVGSTNGSITANYRFDGLTLTSVSGYSSFHTSRLSAYDQTIPNSGGAITSPAFANGFPENFRQWSEELRLLSPTGQPLEWIVGAYYDGADYKLHQFRDYNGLFGFTGGDESNFYQHSETVSVFGQATYHVTDDFRLVGSARYSNTTKNARFDEGIVSDIASPIPGGVCPVSGLGGCAAAYTPASGEVSEGSFDPSLSAQFDVRPDIMLYATWARGSKSGGFVSNTYNQTDAHFAFKPERSTNYEVGMKSELWNDHVQFNVSLFDMTFKNLQESAFDPITQTFITRNAAAATSRGMETSLTWVPIDSLDLTANAAYLDAKYDNFPGAACLATDPIAVCNPASPASVAAHNIAGLPLLYASKWTGNFQVHHNMPIGHDLQIDATFIAALRTSYFDADNYDPFYGIQPSYWKFDARVQLSDIGSNWDVAFVGKNLTNKLTVGDALDFPLGVSRGMQWVDEGRSLSIEATYHFH
jgi:iron complex outermembrane receptor protein